MYEAVSKYVTGLNQQEREKLHGARKRAKLISQTGGTLGLAALGLRAPQLAGSVASRSKKLGGLKSVKRLVAAEPRATNASNTVGVLSIGTGSAGSFNYAGIQRAEAKADEKRLRKADDKFLRDYRDRISPEAERGYRYLKQGRDRRRRMAAVNSLFTAGNLGAAGYYAKKKQPVMAGAAGALSIGSGILAGENISGARRWNSKMDKIKAKGYQRAEQGVYGRDRRPDVAKAFLLTKPKIATYSTRTSGLMRRNGKVYTRRGSIFGTGVRV